jgi:beta-lactamase class A
LGQVGRRSRATINARRRAALLATALLAVAAFAAGALMSSRGGEGEAPNRLGGVPAGSPGPAGSPQRVAAATALAARREGRIAFAVTDGDGRLRGLNERQRFVTASVVKAMLLVADLSRPTRAGRPLSALERRELEEMIGASDNDAATAVYARVRDTGLLSVARRAGMRAFSLGPTAISSCRCTAKGWARAQITAADQALFMRVFPRLVPPPYRSLAKATLARIIPSQRWGIAREAAGWEAYFKIGVRETGLGTLVHQVARLESGHRLVTLAILTDGDPTEDYGKETVSDLSRVLVGGAAE